MKVTMGGPNSVVEVSGLSNVFRGLTIEIREDTDKNCVNGHVRNVLHSV